MLTRQIVLAATIIAACGGGDANASQTATPLDALVSAPTVRAPRPDVTYDKTLQKSIHNAYERSEPLLDQLVYHRARSLELDVHVTKAGVLAPDGDWFVYHEDYPFFRDTSCTLLTDCLGQLAAFHAANPEHEIVTLFVDLKSGFEGGHDTQDLDRTIAAALGRDHLTTPGDLLAACPGATTLREAVTGACHFPTLGALRGKFLFVTTGGNECDASSHVAGYTARGDPRERLGFAGPKVEPTCPLERYDDRPNIVFFNLTLAEGARAAEIKRRGFIPRIYAGGTTGGLDSISDFSRALAFGAVHLATDKVSSDEDAWSATRHVRGFPFDCDSCRDDAEESGPIVGLRSVSGDQDGVLDSGTFAVETDAGDATWSALVSVPSSHVDPLAKACLIARESDAPGAANVSLCRPFDVHSPRLQVRATANGETTSTDAPAPAGLSTESTAFLRLRIARVKTGARVTSEVSADGVRWSVVGVSSLPVSLPLRGVSVSGHSNTKVKGLFSNLVRERASGRSVVHARDLTVMNVGELAMGDVFDGAL